MADNCHEVFYPEAGSEQAVILLAKHAFRAVAGYGVRQAEKVPYHPAQKKLSTKVDNSGPANERQAHRLSVYGQPTPGQGEGERQRLRQENVPPGATYRPDATAGRSCADCSPHTKADIAPVVFGIARSVRVASQV